MSTAEMQTDEGTAAVAELPVAGPSDFVTPPLVAAKPLPPKPKNARYESLDLWRGVACLMLVLFHAVFFTTSTMRLRDSTTWSVEGIFLYALAKTWCGVPIFFVISGYCIAASLDSLRRRPHSLANYFYRRFHRIYPPLWIATLLAVAFLAVTQQFWNLEGTREHLPFLSELSAVQWFGNITATERWVHHLTGGEVRYLMANTWTLCYEEQFYAVAGLMLLLSPRRPLAVALVISLATLFVRHACRFAGINIEGFFFDGHWLLFAAGMLVYQAVNYLSRWQALLAAAVFLAGTAYGWSERRSGLAWFDRHLGEYLLVSSLFALFLMATKQYDSRIARHVLAWPLVWCGKRSYSIYLTHYPLVVTIAYGMYVCGWRDAWTTVFVTVPLCVGVSLLSGWGFFELVERRFQNTAEGSLATAAR